MDNLVIDLIGRGGYWGVFVLMVVENLIPPIPSELIMGMGGVAVARGWMEFWPLLAAGTAGCVVGNQAWYELGNRLGYKRLRPFVERHERWLTVGWDDVDRAGDLFRRRGHWVVFALRFSPFLRTLISLPAGLTHMPRWKFACFTAAGSAVWNVILIKGGEWLGHSFRIAEEIIGWATVGTFVLLAGCYVWRVVRWEKAKD
ncbi:MAG TPA: DedA family protein [Novosphingobium sp.]|nr:DedA family protein [Novosphingobium sp.]